MSAPAPRYPIAPALHAIAAMADRPLHPIGHVGTCPTCPGCVSLTDLANVAGVEKRTAHRWVAEGGIPEPAADRLACNLGLHLDILWPDLRHQVPA